MLKTSAFSRVVISGLAAVGVFLLACGGVVNDSVKEGHAYVAEAWADNWFSMHIGDQLVIEDSVSINTERSFNAERFSFDASPGTVLAFTLKDFKETDSGLEYIGKPNQQMGDGGFVAQVREQASGDVVLVTDSEWRCLVVHEAPINKECESSSDPDVDCKGVILSVPSGWRSSGFDDSGWPAATVHSARDVRPKHGYDAINWDSSAKLIWGPDLQSDNTLLCRVILP